MKEMIERLRVQSCTGDCDGGLISDAADELERLEGKLRTMATDISDARSRLLDMTNAANEARELSRKLSRILYNTIPTELCEECPWLVD